MSFIKVVCASCGDQVGRTASIRVPRILCMRVRCTWPSARANTERDRRIYRAVREDGDAVTAVAKAFGITRQRVYQILNRLDK